MGPATPQPTLNRLRQTLGGDRSEPCAPPCRRGAADRACRPDRCRALGGGLACGALHELAPAAPVHLGAASGFAAGAGRAGERRAPARSFGSPPITRRARAADPTAPASTCSGLPRRGFSCCACRSRSMCSGRWRRRCAAARSPASSPNSPARAQRPISPRRAALRSPRAKASARRTPASAC